MEMKMLSDLLAPSTALIVKSDIKLWDAVDLLTKQIITLKMVQTRGNQTQAAEELGMNRSILRRHLTEIKENAKNS